MLQAPRSCCCPRARLWLRRVPPDLLHDQIGDPLMDTINVLDSHSGPVITLLLLGLLLLSMPSTCFLRLNNANNTNSTGNMQELPYVFNWDK